MYESRHWFCSGFGSIFEGLDPLKVCWRLSGSSISTKVTCSILGTFGMPKGFPNPSKNHSFSDWEPVQKMVWFLNAFLMDSGSQTDLQSCRHGILLPSFGVHFLSWVPFGAQKGPNSTPDLLFWWFSWILDQFVNDFSDFWWLLSCFCDGFACWANASLLVFIAHVLQYVSWYFS